MCKETLYSLIPLDTFKAVMSIDDREDKLAKFCLATSTSTIEQYCKRRLLRKKYFERIEYCEDLFIPLAEYPVNKVNYVFINVDDELLEPELYRVIPDRFAFENISHNLIFSPAIKRYRGLTEFRISYWAGYARDKIPADLASACLELAVWNMNRYREIGRASCRERV